ncbi:MAG: STAS domain-containing protein [Acidobacteriota bacterium]
MQITIREDEGVTILALDGKLVIGDGDVALRDTLKEQLDAGAKKLLLNLKNVKTMDSSGLGELIRCKASANSADASIRLVHVEDKVEEVLEMTRLIGVFETYDNEIDAVASYRD